MLRTTRSPFLAPALAGALLLACCDGPTEPVAAPPVPGNLEAMDGEVREAITAQIALVNQQPTDPAARRMLGLLLQANGSSAEACIAHAQAIQLDPDDAAAWYFLALARADSEDLPAAIVAATLVQQLEPDFDPAWWRTGFWQLDLGRPADALASFERAGALDEQGRQAAHMIGRSRALLDLDRPADAASVLEALISVTNHPYPRFLLAQALRRQGRAEDAAALAVDGAGSPPNFPDARQEQVLKAKRGPGGRMDYIDHLLADARVDDAANEVQAGLTLWPENLRLLNRLSEIHRRRGNPAARIRTLRRAIRIDPDDAPTLHNLSVAYASVGQSDKALEHAYLASQADPDQVAFLLQIGRLERAANRPAASLAALDKAFALTVDDPREHLQYALLLFQVGRLDDSRAVLDRLVKRPGIHADVWAMLSEVAMQQRDHRAALAAALQGLSVAPDHPVLNSIVNRYRTAQAEGRVPDPPGPEP